MIRGLYFVFYLLEYYNGYMIFFDMYDINNVEIVIIKYLFVFKFGEELFF